MIKLVAAFFMMMVMVSVATVYGLKETTERLEARKVELSHKILRDRAAINVLRAEMAYLAQPERLKALSSRFLALAPSRSEQLALSVNVIAGREDADFAALPVDNFPLLLPQEKPVFDGKRFGAPAPLATAAVDDAVPVRKTPKRTRIDTTRTAAESSRNIRKASFYERLSEKLEREE